MTNMQLLEAIGMLDEKTILDAEQPVAKILPSPRKRWMRQITAVAACACLLFGVAVVAQMGGWHAKGESSMDPGAPQDGNPTYAAGETTSAPENGMTATTTAGATAATTTTAATTSVAGEVWTTTTTAWATTTTAPNYTYPLTTTRATYTGTTTEDDPMPEISVPKEGLNVYYETFDGLLDTEDTAAALQAAGMTRLTVASDGVYNETNAAFALRDGRLYCDNITP